jgi:Flp pilus assembly protein TadB
VDLIATICVSGAILSLGIAFRPTAQSRPPLRLVDRLLTHYQQRLAAARIVGNPRTYVVISLVAPVLLFAIGWLQSPVLAISASGAGLFMPRLYLAWLVHTQSARSESEASRLLQSLISGLSVSGTYLEALREARRTCNDPWIQEDLDLVIQRFMLDEPLHETLKEVRARTTTPNLAMIWDTLKICADSQLPAQAARNLLAELSATVQFNVQLVNEVRARSSGQRIQIWLLALIVPAMYAYLRLMSPQLLGVLDETTVGRLVLFPTAAVLEILGIALSFRIARIDT